MSVLRKYWDRIILLFLRPIRALAISDHRVRPYNMTSVLVYSQRFNDLKAYHIPIEFNSTIMDTRPMTCVNFGFNLVNKGTPVVY